MSGKVKIIVSDLHIGAGHEELGNTLEDFNVDEDFVAFLDQLVTRSETESLDMELLVAGDMFEYLQVPHVERFDPRKEYKPKEYSSSSESDSILKTRLMIEGHPEAFQAMAQFLNPEEPRRCLTIIKGNHDVNLFWNGVKTILRDAIDAVGPLYDCLHFESARVNREGIWVEHGNQYSERINRFDDFDDPRDWDRAGQLALPAGSRFVYNYFNDVERERYWVDGVKPITAMIWYALIYDFPFALRALIELIKEIPSIIWESMPWALSKEDRAAGAGPFGPALIAGPEAAESLVRRYSEHPYHRRRVVEMVDRATAWAGPDEGQASEDEDLSGIEAVAFRRAMAIQSAVDSKLTDVAKQMVEREGVKVVVFGHTHRPLLVRLSDESVYANSGTWVWQRDFSGETAETWRDFWMEPERYMTERHLSYVWVEYDTEGVPHAHLMEFEREAPEYGLGTEVRSWWQLALTWLRNTFGR